MRVARGAASLPATSRAVRRSAAVALGCLLLAVAIAVPAPATALWLLLGLVAIILAVTQPWVVALLLVPAVALDSVLALLVGPLRAGPTDLLVGALVLGALLRAALTLLRPSRHTRPVLSVSALITRLRAAARAQRETAAIATAIGAYLLVIILSLVVATSRSDVLKEILKWAEVLATFALAALLLRTPTQRAAAAWTMIAVGVVEALLGYAQWVVAAGDLGVGGAGIRVFGTFDQPNPFSAYLNLSLPLALAIAVLSRKPPARWLAAGAAALMLGAQLLASSRGGLLALGAALAVMLIVGLRIEKIGSGLIAAGALLMGGAWALGLLPHSLQQRALHTFRLDNVSLTGPLNDANFSSVERLAHWVAGIRMFLAHPVLGVGAGNYGAAYARYKVPGWDVSLGHAHDYFINAAAETGVIGLLAFLAFVAATLYVAWRAARSPSPNADAAAAPGHAFERALALGVLGVVVAVVVHSLVDDVFVHGMALQLALCLALAAAMARRGGQTAAVP